MQAHRFNVFGRIYLIQREGAGWKAYAAGDDGKQRDAGFIVPDFIEENELAQYLEDLFHENATPWNGDVVRLD